MQTGISNLAASWYVAIASKRLGKKPVALKLFGQDLVAWRDSSGQPIIMERYCSHMGASLAKGKVKDGCLICPFHHWQYDRQGQCVKAPELERIPKTARQITYPTHEQYGYIWAWYGSEAAYPVPEFAPAEKQRAKYLELRYAFKVNTTVRRVVENFYDYRHIVVVHGANASKMDLSLYSGQTDRAYFSDCGNIPAPALFGGTVDLKFSRYVGFIGILADWLGLKIQTGQLKIKSWVGGHIIALSVNEKVRSTALVSVTPVSQEETIQHYLFMVRKDANFFKSWAAYVLFGFQSLLSAWQDAPIWNNLKWDGGGAYTKQDIGVLKFREYYDTWVAQEKVKVYADV